MPVKDRKQDYYQPVKSDDNQSSRFVAAARELCCDEDEASFREKLAKIARRKPKDSAAKAVRPKRTKD